MYWNKKTNGNHNVILMSVATLLALGIGNARADFIFGEPVNTGPTVNGEAEDWGASFSADGLELYFSSRRSGGYGNDDLWVSMRATTEDEWGIPANLGSTVNSSARDYSLSISSDGLELYFASKRSGGLGSTDLWVTSRATTNDLWGKPENLGSNINTSSSDGRPCISHDGLELYFSSKRSDEYDQIWVTQRATKDGPWGTPVKLAPPVNIAAVDFQSSLSADGLTMFFCSWRGGYGEQDIWVTTRATKDSPWTEPKNVGGTINTSDWETEPALTHDDSILCYTSRHPGGSGGFDLWQVAIEPVIDFNSDNRIDIQDLVLLVEHWGENYSLCDIGPTPLGDGIVDVQDLVVLTEHMEPIDRTLTHWALDETEGDVAYDSAGGNDAVVIGDAAWQPEGGQVGGALEFDGDNDHLAAPFILDPLNRPFSVFAWIKGGRPGQTIISQQGAFGAWLSVDTAGALSTSLAFPLPPVTSNVVITDGQWHRIGLVSDGSGISLYVDDIEVIRSDSSPILPANGDLQIGAGKNLEPGSFWSGMIDDVCIYDRIVIP